MPDHRALAARLARLEVARRATGASCGLVVVEAGASGAEKAAAVAAHRAATGYRGPVMITVPRLEPAEWELRYGAAAGRS